MAGRGVTLLTVEEAAELARCQPRTLRAALRAGELPAFFSSRWFVEEEAVWEWMRRRADGRTQRPVARRRASRAPKRRDDRVGSVSRLQAIRGEETGS